MPKNMPIEIIKKIRKEVKKGKPKLQVSKELNISYNKVRENTKDIKTIKRGISEDLAKKIREKVKNGKTKRQVALQYSVTDRTVYYHTRDICSYPLRNMRVQDKKLELMKGLMRDGYALSSKGYSTS